MKFLDSPPIARINACLNSGIDLTDYTIYGRLEAYSCAHETASCWTHPRLSFWIPVHFTGKLAANDKKIKKDVEQKVLEGLGMLDGMQEGGDFVASSLTGSLLSQSRYIHHATDTMHANTRASAMRNCPSLRDTRRLARCIRCSAHCSVNLGAS
jgi:hypothetical protein